MSGVGQPHVLENCVIAKICVYLLQHNDLGNKPLVFIDIQFNIFIFDILILGLPCLVLVQ